MVFCNCVLPLLLSFRALRVSHLILAIVAFGSIVGMWLERFNIVQISLTAHQPPLRLGLPTLPPSGTGPSSPEPSDFS